MADFVGGFEGRSLRSAHCASVRVIDFGGARWLRSRPRVTARARKHARAAPRSKVSDINPRAMPPALAVEPILIRALCARALRLGAHIGAQSVPIACSLRPPIDYAASGHAPAASWARTAACSASRKPQPAPWRRSCRWPWPWPWLIGWRLTPVFFIFCFWFRLAFPSSCLVCPLSKRPPLLASRG